MEGDRNSDDLQATRYLFHGNRLILSTKTFHSEGDDLFGAQDYTNVL